MKDRLIDALFYIFLFLVIAVAGASVLLYVVKFGFGFDAISDSLERWGQTGDFFGGTLNPLFALVTVFALLVTIKQNERAINQSAAELELSRKEMAKSAEASQRHAGIADLQRFESTFFALLELLGDIVGSLEIRFNDTGGDPFDALSADTQKIQGRRVFYSMYGTFRRKFASKAKSFATDKDRYEKELNDQYMKYYSTVDHVTGHYFRTLYNIIKFIDESSIEDKEFYVKLVRAQLSTYELLFLFYNCLTKMGAEKMRPYVIKYELLKHLERQELVDVTSDVELLIKYFSTERTAD